MKATNQINEALKLVLDPELHVNIVDLGLIYGTKLDSKGLLTISMTLTTPGCPLMPVIEAMIRAKLRAVKEVKNIKIKLTFDPPWDASKMSPETRSALGF